MKKNTLFIIIISAIILLVASCRGTEKIVPSTSTDTGSGTQTDSTSQVDVSKGKVKGFFLLNEGNMGSNKSTLDYYDYETGIYTKNIYAERNPGVVKELGDVGNDLQIYGNKLYAVINCSNFVEVMDVRTAKHITTISVPNCRYIVFKDSYAYISSYAGPVKIDPNQRLGYVARVDTADLLPNLPISVHDQMKIDTCIVGYQPEEMVISGDKLYVANSGGYMVPNYDSTVSVISLATFKEIKKINVGINLHRLELDRYGHLYVTSRGDYYNISSKTYVIDTKTDEVINTLYLLPASEMTICGDSLYAYSTEWSYVTNRNTVSYAIYNTKTQRIVSRNYISDGTDKKIKIPYGTAVNPDNNEILVTDAVDYVTPGTLYCFRADGSLKWSVVTGDIPAHIAFTYQKLQPLE